MSALLIAITGIIYLGVAIDQLYKGNTPMAMCYIGYAFANVGMYKLAS